MFDVSNEDLAEFSEITIKFYSGDDNNVFFVFYKNGQDEVPTGIALTDGNPVGDAKPVEYITNNQLADNKTGIIHSFTAQPLDNGYIRFCIEYTVPEKLLIHVFNPPSGSKLNLRDNNGTPNGKGALVFDVSNEDLAEFSEITIKFYSGDDNNVFFVFYKNGQDEVPTGIALTDGNPVGDAKPVEYITNNQLADNKTGIIHSFTAQPLDNGYIRFCIEYTVPEKLCISVFSLPDASKLSLQDTSGTPSGKGVLVFDVSDEDIAEFSEIAIKFYFGFDNAFFVFYQNVQDKVPTGIALTNGNPVGDAKPVEYMIDNLLADNKTGIIHSFTAQSLDNGYIRFCVEYTVPEKMYITVFNPPDGSKLRLQDTSGTPSGKGALVFDVSDEDIAEFSAITISFSAGDDNVFFVFFQNDQF